MVLLSFYLFYFCPFIYSNSQSFLKQNNFLLLQSGLIRLLPVINPYLRSGYRVFVQLHAAEMSAAKCQQLNKLATPQLKQSPFVFDY